MFETEGKRNIFGLVAPVSLAVSLSFGAGAVYAGSYVTSSSGDIVYNNFKECWDAATGTVKNAPYCSGDAAVMPELAPVLMTQRPVGDSDGDGVNDDVDQCPDSTYRAVVNHLGCFVDHDSDGIADSRDRCPDTLWGATVDAEGCAPLVSAGPESLHEVLSGFAFDKSNTVLLKPFDEAKLQTLAEAIKGLQGGEKQVYVAGYTDSVGPETYNKNLSERRAQTVADYLAKHGVRNITVKGMGEANPVGDNDTPEGRALNRRVEVTAR